MIDPNLLDAASWPGSIKVLNLNSGASQTKTTWVTVPWRWTDQTRCQMEMREAASREAKCHYVFDMFEQNKPYLFRHWCWSQHQTWTERVLALELDLQQRLLGKWLNKLWYIKVMESLCYKKLWSGQFQKKQVILLWTDTEWSEPNYGKNLYNDNIIEENNFEIY